MYKLFGCILRPHVFKGLKRWFQHHLPQHHSTHGHYDIPMSWVAFRISIQRRGGGLELQNVAHLKPLNFAPSLNGEWEVRGCHRPQILEESNSNVKVITRAQLRVDMAIRCNNARPSLHGHHDNNLLLLLIIIHSTSSKKNLVKIKIISQVEATSNTQVDQMFTLKAPLNIRRA